MTKAVSSRDIYLIKPVLLLCKHGHFSQNFASHGLFCPPPHNIIRVQDSALNPLVKNFVQWEEVNTKLK